MCITGTACDAVRHPNKCDSHLRTHSDRSKCREYRTQWRHALHRPDTSPVPHRAERRRTLPGPAVRHDAAPHDRRPAFRTATGRETVSPVRGQTTTTGGASIRYIDGAHVTGPRAHLARRFRHCAGGRCALLTRLFVDPLLQAVPQRSQRPIEYGQHLTGGCGRPHSLAQDGEHHGLHRTPDSSRHHRRRTRTDTGRNERRDDLGPHQPPLRTLGLEFR